jgi:hypothetical protein
LNSTVINNLQEIKENAINAYNVNEDGTEQEAA